MSSKTKIVVLKMKELIYAAIFVGLAVILIILFFFMFSGKNKDSDGIAGSYTSGVYSSSITLAGQAIDVEVTVDRDHINAIHFVNLSDDIATMFPLMETTLESLTEQILQQQSLENLRYDADAKYTSIVLVNAIQSALNKAAGIPAETSGVR